MTYYGGSTIGFFVMDKLVRPPDDPLEPVYEDAFFNTDEGETVLAEFKDKQRQKFAQRKENDKTLMDTEEGRAKLELEKQQRGLTSVHYQQEGGRPSSSALWGEMATPARPEASSS